MLTRSTARRPGPGSIPRVPSPDDQPKFLPGDRDFPADRSIVPEEPPRPPARRVPIPVLVVGGLVVLALLTVGFIGIRIALGDPASRGAPGPGEPMTTLKPREGTPAPLQKARIGERIEIQGLYGKGTVMVVSHEWSDKGDLAPSQGRRYLNLNVRYDCTEGSLFLKQDYFTGYDLQKNEYYAGIGSGKDPLPTQELKAGRSATGWVSIELPPAQSFFVISDEGINPLVMVDIPRP